MSSAPDLPAPEGIAIVGMAGRFPGARNVDEFWRNLVAGAETIERLSDEQLSSAGLDAAALRADPHYVPARGRIERPEWFDADFFGITPREAEVMDPQQRVFLEEAWTALEDAGCDPARYAGAIGVFAGMSNNTYWANNVAGHRELIEAVGALTAMMGNEKDYLATRVAYKLNLRGPALNVYTACSTSLVAVCQACTALLNYQCDAALAGGISITFPQERGYRWSEGGITSPDGHCRAFDVQAAGTVFGSGVGVVVLKRLSEALAEDDQIYAVIKGAALNNDGSGKVSFTAPSVNGHAEVIALAHALGGISADSISYVEAHGTGTPLGDPIEIAGLTQAFRAGTARKQFCALGSVKTNIGHLDAAAGVAGLIKTALALRHRFLPASLHFTAPNPQLELESSPFFIAKQAAAWREGATPRRAGVSSFGVGGTNAHVVVEEAPVAVAQASSLWDGQASRLMPGASASTMPACPTGGTPVPLPAPGGGRHALLLSARSIRALEDATAALAQFLKDQPEASLADVAFTLQRGRRHFAHRRFVVATTAAEAARHLIRRDRRYVFTTRADATAPAREDSGSDSLNALGHRWLAGETIDWAAEARAESGRKISLPTYPFERRRFWSEPASAAPAASNAPTAQPVAAPLVEGDALAQLITFLSDFSGLSMSGAGPNTSLVELGFDSLFLTQIAIALQKKFGVRLRFRQFLEELGTLGALAEFLRGNTAPPAVAPTILAPRGRSSTPAAPLRHGPFRKIDTAPTPQLTARQQAYLDALIARYAERTAGSKRHTAAHRPHFADPRAVSGFRRALKEVVYPLVSDRSLGSRLWDIDGHEYVDITLGFGQILFGHRAPFVVAAIEEQLGKGIEIGPTSPLAGEVAALVCELTGLQRAAFCNTGSEALIAAIRVARTVTGRDKIAMFAGAYHGIFDEVLVRPAAGDGAVAIAPGIPAAAIANILVLDYGNPEALDAIRRHAHELAAVLVEPVQSRRPELQPRDFLRELRAVTAGADIALVFDEVVTGFRCHPGGAQALFGVKADLATYGKVVGGGMPIGIVAGDARFMDALDGGAWKYGDDSVPEIGVTFFAGTFVRHPLALAAARAVLTQIKEHGIALQQRLDATTEDFVGELNAHFARRAVPLHWSRFCSCYHLAIPAELKYAGLLFHLLRLRGVHAWEGRPCFLSTAHTAEDLHFVARAFRESVDELIDAGLLPGFVAATRYGATSVPGETFALTEAQQELLLASQLGPHASAAFNESISLRLRGPLDVPALQSALHQLIARHDALRATISPEGQTQCIAAQRAVELPATDLRGVSAEAQPEARAHAVLAHTSKPFDLEKGPLLHAELLRLDDDRHDLLLTAHHIVCDGWSFDIIICELAALYSAIVAGTAPDLPVAAQFAEYARQERLQRATPAFAAAEKFWLAQFEEPPAPFDLPADRPRPAQRSWAGAREEILLPADLRDAVAAFSARHGATMFAVLLAGFQAFLHRVSGASDLVVGIPAAGQSLGGHSNLIGHCANLLPLRRAVTGTESFLELLAGTKRGLLDALDHHDFSFGLLLQRLKLARDPGRMPLVSASFNVDPQLGDIHFGELAAEVALNPRRHYQFDFSFNVVAACEGLRLQCNYNPDLFDAATIQRWMAHYRTLLESLTHQPSQPIAQLGMLTPPERRQLLFEWNQTALPLPEGATLHGLFEAAAARTPDACALLDHGSRLTYRELDRRASRIAARLLQIGVTAETPVGICLERSADLVAAILGVLKAGGAYLPLDPAYPPARLAAILEDAQPSLVLCDAAAASMHAPKRNGVTAASLWETVADIAASRAEIGGDLTDAGGRAPNAAPAQLAYLIYTSGSTGQPKGVAIEHRQAVALVHWARQVFSAPELAGVLAATSVCFDLSVFEMFVPLAAGGTVVMARNILELPELPDADAVTLVNTVPSALAELLRAGRLPANVKTVNLAGEPLSTALVEKLRAGGTVERVLDLYGPTETTTYSTFTERSAGLPPTIGRAIANTELYLLDAHRQPVAIGMTGELWIGGAGVARGYWNQPGLTAERFVANPFCAEFSRLSARLYRTGDLARFRGDGQLVYLGRADQQVKIRGFRIELGDIEAALAAHPAVRETVVVALPEGDGKMLVAYFVSAGEKPEVESLRAHLQTRVPEHMIPSVFVALERLPLNKNGKLDRTALPAPESGRVGTATEFVAPRNAAEQRVAEVWREVLRLDRVGVHDNFFHAGGHSLAAMQVVSRLRETLAPGLSMLRIFEQPTIAGFVEALPAMPNGHATREEGVL